MALLTQSAGQGSFYSTMIFFVVMIAIFYLLLIRPQQKRMKARNLMLSNLKKGDRVVTIGGIHGKIVELTDDTAVLQVSENVRLTFNRGAVEAVVSSASSEE